MAEDGSGGRMFRGRRFAAEEVALIGDVVSRCGALSRTELANTVCELLWVRVKNLASTILSLSVRRMREDWREDYAVDPWFAETLVDSARYRGGCYRAANWSLVGTTSGRGRMDRGHQRHGAHPKSVWVCPLSSATRARLCRTGGSDARLGGPQ